MSDKQLSHLHIVGPGSVFPGLLFLGIMMFYLVPAGAQELRTSSGKVYPGYDNKIDWLVVMYDISGSSELTFVPEDASADVSWYRYPDLQNAPVSLGQRTSGRFVSNQTVLNPEGDTGYIVRVTGVSGGQSYEKEYSVWVIDYKQYVADIENIDSNNTGGDVCEELHLDYTGNIPEMYYMTPSGQRYVIRRDFTLQYESLEWGTDDWVTSSVSEDVYLENGGITLNEPPYKDTYFNLTGDQFATDLGIPLNVRSSYYTAARVICKILTEASTRTEKNEADRPDMASTLSGSAPLEINFTAKANPAATYFNWEIYKEGELLVSRIAENHRYTFTEAGTFVVRLHAENAYCSATDSVTVKVSESAISAPNVFSPNGDNVNDEFRVGYKSIVEFRCWIYNRWGNQLYSWTDPQKGWDGTYKGKPVAEGAYFYVIKARGSDGINYNLKGDINLLRGKDQ